MRASFVALVPIFLASCISPEEQAYRREQAEYQRQQEEAAYIAGLANKCEQFGFARGSDQHKQCMLSLHQQNVAARAAAAAAVLQGAAAAEIQNSQARRPVVPTYAPPPTYNTNCTRDYLGNLNCTTRPQ